MKTQLALFAVLMALQAAATPVAEVKVKALDGFGGDVSAVAARCQTKSGGDYSPVVLSRDVRALEDSGEFEEIAADANQRPEGVEVVFYVKRKVRFLPPLVVTGASFFSESKIAKEAGLKDGFLYGEADLAAAAARVRLAYQKKAFLDAKVTPRVTLASGHQATVTFLVDEGTRRKTGEVVFKGAAHAVESSLFSRQLNPFFEIPEGSFDAIELREAVSDYPWWNPVGWFADAPMTADERAQSCDKLVEVFRRHGYLDARVTGPELAPREDGKASLVYTVEEGPCYRVGKATLTGVSTYRPEDVRAKCDWPAPGAIATQTLLDDVANQVKVAVGSGDKGLADTRVDVRLLPREDASDVVDVVFAVTEGVPVVLHDVKIRGNDYTKDRVIRREIALAPGDRMLEDRAQRSKRRLENLDYFSRVSYALEPTGLGLDESGAESRDLVYEVEEKNTGSFMVGIGASSVDSVYVSAEVNQNNFDLFAPSKLFRGAGQKGRAYVAWGPRYQSAEIGVAEPYFLDRMMELSVDVYRRMRWYDQYDLIRSGAQVSLSYPVKFWPTWSPFGRLGVGLSGEFIEMDDVDQGLYQTKDGKAVSFREEEQKYSDAFEPVVHLFWTKDARDSFRIPTRGFRTKVFVDVAPAGDNQYWKAGVNHRHYWPFFKRYNHVLMFAFRAETMDGFDGDVPVYNRLFLGGPKSIRGVEYRHVSPFVRRTSAAANSWSSGDYAPWGGQTLVCGTFEYTIPIVKMLRVAVFTDFGSVGESDFEADFSDTFAWTAGLGLRLDIPMFPIRLDFATPIEKPDHAEEEVFSFTVGYDF